MRAEHWIYTLPLRLRSLLRRGDVERDLDDELRDHVEQHIAQLMTRGLTAGAARTEALRALGGVERRKDEMRETRRVSTIESLVRDLRYAFRTLRRTPTFTAVAIVTLALGIGANTAIFTVVNAVLLRPLPYADPSRLVLVQYTDHETVAPAYLARWQRAGLRSFERMAAAQYTSPTLTGGERPEQIQGLRIGAGILPMMGVSPLLGRMFDSSEAHDGRNHVAILSYPFWQRRYGGDSTILGRAIIVDGAPVTVVGVMPRDFRFAPFWATHTDIWTPLSLDGLDNDRAGSSLRIFARLRPGVSVEQARAEVAAFGIRLKREMPDAHADITVTPLLDRVVGSVKPALLILLAAVALVLLIACANVTHLQLMRAVTRERETAVRVALGAGTYRVVQQSMIESILVALAGGAAGLALALGGVRLLTSLGPDIPRLETVQLDGRVFMFMFLVAVTAGLLAGTVPALVASRVDAQMAMREGGRAGSSRRKRRTGAILVASEFAMAVVLLVGAGLVMRSFAAMVGFDPGMDPRNLLTMKISTRGTAHSDPAQRALFYQQLSDQVRALPGVEAVGMTNHLPMHGDTWAFGYFIDGAPLPPPGDAPKALFRVVRSGYFGAMRIPIVRGRDVTLDEEQHQGHAMLIDQHLARAAFGTRDAIGQRLSIEDAATGPEWFTIVGVVQNVEQGDWDSAPQPEMFFPYWASPVTGGGRSMEQLLYPNYITLVVRSREEPHALQRQIEQIVRRIDPDAPIAGVITMNDAIASQVSQPRFYVVLLAAFAAVALLLAAIGIYGVISYSVSNRSREIGIMLALGADRRTPFRMVVRQGLRLAVIGAVVGVAGALVLTRFLGTLLYDVSALDPVTFAAVPLALVAIAAAACAVPAHRAASVDPAVALRAD